jgi:hypothetical protein
MEVVREYQSFLRSCLVPSVPWRGSRSRRRERRRGRRRPYVDFSP